MSLPQQTEQRRAGSAWKAVDDLKTANFGEQYGTIVRKLPMLVLTNGLGPTLAFLLAKSRPKDGQPEAMHKAHHRAYMDLSKWVMSCMSDDVDLMEWVRTKKSSDYRRATAETLAYLTWLKRFVEAQGLGGEDRDESTATD